MRFAEPWFLVAGLAACTLLFLLFVRLGRVRARALRSLGSPHLLERLTASVSRRRRRVKQAMLLGGLGLMFVALARPELGYRREKVEQRGVDLLFAVDTSKSMLTQDVKPDRLERAKLAVSDLVRRFPNNRVGLIAFAGTAFLETPLTLDHSIFEQSLQALDTQVIPRGGTDIASAIRVADQALAKQSHQKKIVILLTDGGDLAGGALAEARRAARDGLHIYTVGVGTPRGQLIPVPGANGQTHFVHDPSGKLVTSKLDEPLLRRIAIATGASYRALGDSGQGLAALYRDDLSKLPRAKLGSRTREIPIDRYQWPLGLALLLLGFEPLVSERKRRRGRSHAEERVTPRHPRRLRHGLAGAAGVCALVLASAAQASPQSAQRDYSRHQYKQAERSYARAAKKDPHDARLGFNLGAAAYKNQDFKKAAGAFESALGTGNLKLQEEAYYNLGNARFRIGQGTEKHDVEQTIRSWKQSISAYQAALKLAPRDRDARFNLALVKRRLAALQKKHPKPPPEQRKKNKHGQKQDSQGGGRTGNKQRNKSGKGKQKQKQNSQGSGQQKQNANNKPGHKPQQPKPGHKPQQPKPQPASTHEQPSAPGRLSKQDAKALLDSLRGELEIGVRAPRSPKHAANDEPRRDW